MVRRGDIPYQQSDWACRLRQGVTERHRVVARLSVLDAAFRGRHRLVRETLQPQDARQERAPARELVDHLEANDVWPTVRRGIAGGHALDMAPCTDEVASEVVDLADHPLADHPIVPIG